MRRDRLTFLPVSRQFQSTHPVWDATSSGSLVRRPTNFNPRIPCGMRHASRCDAYRWKKFQSTHPVWDATFLRCSRLFRLLISIHASRVGCDKVNREDTFAKDISIHASRVGCDSVPPVSLVSYHISIHASRVGCDRDSARRQARRSISIHASRVGCDLSAECFLRCSCSISIHASRVGCDFFALYTKSKKNYFNPRIPCGMRPVNISIVRIPDRFQSAHPVWDATQWTLNPSTATTISIHASRVGCDVRRTHRCR